jgi:hypothetical protein
MLRSSSPTSIFSIRILIYLINFVLCNRKNRSLISTDSEHLFVILNIYLPTVRKRTTTCCSLLSLRPIRDTWNFRWNCLLSMICIVLHRSGLNSSLKLSFNWLRRCILDSIWRRRLSIFVLGWSINLTFNWNRPLRGDLFFSLFISRGLWRSRLMRLIANSLSDWFLLIRFEWYLTIL